MALDPRRDSLDLITRHRLQMLGIDASPLEAEAPRARAERVHARFVERLPFENLSNHRACRASPRDPTVWPRATDRVLRDHEQGGFGGTSFSLAYALRDLLHGVGTNAHLALGRNLVTEELHAVVLVFLEDGTLLYDPAMLTRGPIPATPGGTLADPLGTVRLEPCRGRTLTLTLCKAGSDQARPVYSLTPVPVAPQRYRQAWIASFDRGRCRPLRLARRAQDVIHRYTEGPDRLEVLTPRGTESHHLDHHDVGALHDLFGIRVDCLKEWLDR